MSAIETPKDANDDQQQSIESPGNTKLVLQAKDLTLQLRHISVEDVHAYGIQRCLSQPPSCC